MGFPPSPRSFFYFYLKMVFEVMALDISGSDSGFLGSSPIYRRYQSVSQFSHSVMSNSATPWTAARQASLSITNLQSKLKLMSIESVVIVMPYVRIPRREERRLPRQSNSQKEKFITDSSQGSCHIQRSGAGSESPEPKLLPKFIGCALAVGSWLKRFGYMFAKQFYWYKLLQAFFKLGCLRAFQLSLDRFPLFLTGRILIGWLQVA